MNELTPADEHELESWDLVARLAPRTGRVVLHADVYLKLRAALAAQPGSVGEPTAWSVHAYTTPAGAKAWRLENNAGELRFDEDGTIHQWDGKRIETWSLPPTAQKIVAESLRNIAAAPTEAKPAQQDAVDARLVYASPIFTTAIDALNKVKAWRDCDGNDGFPHDVREQIDAVLMAYEARAAISAKKAAS